MGLSRCCPTARRPFFNQRLCLVNSSKSIVTGVLSEQGTVGIFGTSIAATWLAASLGDKVTFFVDEDRNRVGLSHLSRPIYNPAHAPKGSHIVVPMRTDIAVAIAKRFEELTCKFVLPSV